jgi:hypothetical protein
MTLEAGAMQYAAYFQDLKDSQDTLYFIKCSNNSWVSFTHRSIHALL